MSQSGYTPIQLYSSSTASAVPVAGNLSTAELALNTADMKLYAKNSSGVVTLLASNAGASGSVTSVAMSVPAFLSVSGSPITSSGTLAVTLSGTALPTANGGTGNTNGTVAKLQTTNFSIQESGGKLYFYYGATAIASMDSSGNFIALANVTAYGTP